MPTKKITPFVIKAEARRDSSGFKVSKSMVFSEKELVADLKKNRDHFDELAVVLPNEMEH